MAGRRSDGELSKRPRAIRRRAEYAEMRALARIGADMEAHARVEAGLAAAATKILKGAAAIGVFTAKEKLNPSIHPEGGPKTVDHSNPQEQLYHCADCLSPVPLGSKVCPICEREVIWAEGVE